MDQNLIQISPSISVVMSVYNGEKYLREAIESILNQTYTDFEFIIINDGSNDKSLEIIKSYSDPRIMLIDNGINKGLIFSLNKGIEIAKGKYIARMDQDDISLPERFKLQVNQFKDHPNAIIVGSDYYLLNGKKNTYIKNINDSDYNKAVLLFSPCFCHPTVMMKNVFRETNISYDKQFVHAEDYKLWTDLSHIGEYLNVDKPLLKYRHHASQISNQKHEFQLNISKLIREHYLQKLNFTLSEAQFEVVNIIGNNTFIKSVELLKEIESCLLHLKEQNDVHYPFNDASFKRFLQKFWLDSCGNTDLGMKAYSLYFKSKISTYSDLSFVDKNIFLAKCVIRKFKN